jgi:hypothetical protein
MTKFVNGALETNDLELRSEILVGCKDGVDPRTAVSDYGDHDADFSDGEHSKSNGNNRSNSSDISTPTHEQTAD